MRRLIIGSILGIAFGVIISIFFSVLFANGQYNPVYPDSFMGKWYYHHLKEIQIMIVAVIIWIMIGITFSYSSLIFTHLKFSRFITTAIHFIIMLAIFFPLAIFAGWFPLKLSALIIFLIVFIITYSIIWAILNKKNKETIHEINDILKERRND